MGKRIIKIVILFIVLGLLAGGGVVGWVYSEFTRPGPLERDTVVVVPAGGGVKSIAAILLTHKVVRSAQVFEWGARVSGDAASLRAGEFSFPSGVSALGVVGILKSGKTVQRRLTIAEGLSSPQIIAQLNGTDGLDGALLTAPPEGSLLPETYYFSYGDSRQSIIERMRRDMDRTVRDLWATRQEGLPLETPGDAVILASIVEKETGISAERARVASVFINRLRLGMRLQSDPTVAFGVMADGMPLDRPLTKADLKTPTAYNTYVIPGLPPGPIANPGVAALQAVLHPINGDDLYFVADGTGGHAFAKTLEEHNRNVRRWRKVQAEQNNGG